MKKVLSTVLCIGLSLSMLSGCGKKEEKAQDTGTYKFAVLAPITGNYAEYGKGFDVATKMAVDKINAAGGVKGKKMELVLYDSKGDPKESADISRRLVDDKSILGVIGDFSSSNCMANAPILGEGGLVQLSPTASHTDYASMNEYMFSIMGRQDGEAPFFSTYLLKKYKQVENTGLIYINNDWGKSAYDNFTKQAKIDGLNIVAEENYVEGERDFTSLLTKVKAANPQIVTLIMHANDVALIANQMGQMGWKVDIAALGPGTSMQIVELGGKNVEGLVLSTPFFINEENKEAFEWAKEFKNKAGFEPTVHPAVANDCVYLIKAAIENIEGEITRDAIRDKLQNLEDFVGLTGPIKFNPSGDITRKYLICGIEDGKFVQKTDFNFAK